MSKRATTKMNSQPYQLFTNKSAPISVQQGVNENTSILPVGFAPISSFPVSVTPQAECRRRQEIELERLKERLLDALLSENHNSALCDKFLWAARDAAAVAWTTPCSLLVFPALFEEHVAAAKSYAQRQAQLLSAG